MDGGERFSDNGLQILTEQRRLVTSTKSFYEGVQVTEKLRIGVVGVGYMGSLHAQHFAVNPHVDLIGVVDTDFERAGNAAQSLNCLAFAEPAALLGRIDAVSVAVPSVQHREVADIFLNEGVHLLMEKPLAPTVADAQAVVDAARRNNVKLLVGHQERFNAAIMKITHRIDKPILIEATRHGQFAGRGGDVDVITDLMIHDIDLVLAMIHSPVVSVSALGASVITPHVDIANARLEFADGAVANVTASRVANGKIRNFRIYMNDEVMDLDLLDQSVWLEKQQFDGMDGRQMDLIRESIDTVPTITLKNEIDHFVEIVRNGGAPFVSGEDAISALRVVQSVREKIDQC